eukprot:15145335-Ditylum_brightwellii.AAC.2
MAVLAALLPTMAPGIKAHFVADFDIVCEIQLLVSTEIPLEASWVKAHQDNTKPWEMWEVTFWLYFIEWN